MSLPLRSRYSPLTSIALALAALAPSAAIGQAPASSFPQVEIHGRLHTQAFYYDSDEYRAVVGASSNVIIRRARINALVRLSDRVSVSIMPSFENARGRGDFRLRDAYADFRLSRPDAPTSLTLRFGQEKRPFSRLELSTSNTLPGLERGAGPGLLPVQSNDLFGAAGFLSDDLGAAVVIASGPFWMRAGVYNGSGDANKDVNDAKSFGARATYELTPQFSIGGAVYSHDGIVGTDSSFRNTAFEIDAQWGRPGDAGLYALGEVLQGEAFAAGDRTMRGLIGVLAYNFRTRGERPMLFAVEPAIRVDIADPDTDGDDDGSSLIAGAVGLYFTPRAQLRVALEHQAFQMSGAPSITGVRSAVFVNF
jgi:hypothetical protein